MQASDGNWITDQRTKCRVWNPFPKPNESVTWSGACKNGLAQGHGTLEWFEDGKSTSVDQGEWRDDERNGHGVYTYNNGDRYEGEWRDDKPNGHGVLTDANGVRFDGDWRDGCFSLGNKKVAIGREMSSCP